MLNAGRLSIPFEHMYLHVPMAWGAWWSSDTWLPRAWGWTQGWVTGEDLLGAEVWLCVGYLQLESQLLFF